MGTEIEKQQTKKQIRQLCILAVRRKKRKKNKKKSITSGNPTIISIHAPHHVKKDTVVQ
jgi:hypothetical protein